VTKARLAEIGVFIIGQLAKTPRWSLERLLGPAAGEKLAALAWNRDPREIETHRPATRSVTLGTPISATVILAETAEELVRAVLADHPDEQIISLLAISVSHLEAHCDVQLELPLGLENEARRPGTKKGMARWVADCAVDRIRDRFGWDAVGYGSVALGISRSVPDEFRKLAEKDL
jgi:DNA polymerase IV